MANQYVMRSLKRHRYAVAAFAVSAIFVILALLTFVRDNPGAGLMFALLSVQASIVGLGLGAFMSFRLKTIQATARHKRLHYEMSQTIDQHLAEHLTAIESLMTENSWRSSDYLTALDERLFRQRAAVQSTVRHNSWRNKDYLTALEERISGQKAAVQSTIRHNSWRHAEWAKELDKKLEPIRGVVEELVPLEPFTRDAELTPAESLSVGGWPEPRIDSRPLTMAVMDEFTEGCFGHDLNLLQPRPDNWLALAKKYKPKLIFVESAWKGKGRSWQYRVGNYSVTPGSELSEMTRWGRENGVPSVFWNKEDPVHHDKFMAAAKSADHIFTTDANMIDSYKKKTGKASVHALPFAAQPALHRPKPLTGRISKAAFAGSWYGNRHAERGSAMQWLLESALGSGLDIFDRNHGTGTFPFPAEFSGSVKGGLPYLELCREYAKYRVFLNVNSVTNSPTMFSRRVFELMASGTPVISTYALGIEELFSDGAVWLVDSPSEAREALDVLLNDDEEWRRRSLAGIREVFAHHTYAHRANDIFRICGVGKQTDTSPGVLFKTKIVDDSDLQTINAFADNQSYRNFKVLAEVSPGYTPEHFSERISPVAPGVANVIALDAEESGFSLMGQVSTRHHYGRHYLRDLVNASQYQPGGAGWGKSLEQDAFSYDGSGYLSGSIWRPEIFRQNWAHSEDHLVTHDGLFFADSSEFSPGTAL
ncbi:glycosyltransferase [Arthrobacter sp. PAMC25284]|uniref:CgeB family protein n=1 Tax=Arthrobacter sp. PAMC25284 TaxID=2861279 RepID=UPI001C639DF5|nr:glycosyltransferase [Arthrobacter sp. PAMC25284]QYF89898.1 glycosyltransferase [Arthrobacter sp. PAMC25284]